MSPLVEPPSLRSSTPSPPWNGSVTGALGGEAAGGEVDEAFFRNLLVSRPGCSSQDCRGLLAGWVRCGRVVSRNPRGVAQTRWQDSEACQTR